ncbi:hypothetical protein U1Q18_012106 [Sarracenia purpurea var. burkii]
MGNGTVSAPSPGPVRRIHRRHRPGNRDDDADVAPGINRRPERQIHSVVPRNVTGSDGENTRNKIKRSLAAVEKILSGNLHGLGGLIDAQNPVGDVVDVDGGDVVVPAIQNQTRIATVVWISGAAKGVVDAGDGAAAELSAVAAAGVEKFVWIARRKWEMKEQREV